MTAIETLQERIETLLSLKSNHIEQIDLINSELDELGYLETRSDEQISEIVIAVINNFFKIDIRHKTRKGKHPTGRQYYWKIMRNETKLTWNQIGLNVNCTNHSTAICGVDKFNDLYYTDKRYQKEYNVCFERFKNKL